LLLVIHVDARFHGGTVGDQLGKVCQKRTLALNDEGLG